MSSPNPPVGKHAGAAGRIDAIERELRRMGRWSEAPLPPEKFRFTQAFAADTMTLEQWLQFIFIPRVRSIIAENGAFPPSSQVGTYAVRDMDGDDEAAGLVSLLCEFDGFITGTSPDWSGPAPEPVGGDHPRSDRPPSSNDPFTLALAEFRNGDFLRECATITERLGREIPFDIDWDSVGAGLRDETERLRAARRWLPDRGVSDVRSALCLLTSNYGDAAAEAVVKALKRIKLRCVAEGEPTSCTFKNGVLDLAICLKEGGARKLSIGAVLVDALDLRTGPVIEKLKTETIPEAEKELKEKFESPIAVEIDLPGFLAEPDVDDRLRALENLPREGLYYLTYGLGSVAGKDPFRAIVRSRLTGLRIRHVADTSQMELAAEGSTAVLSVRLCDHSNGCLYASDIERLLPGVLVGLPGPSLPASARTPEQLLTECRKIAATAQGRISAAVGSPVNLDVDWTAIAGDAQALSRLPHRALQRAVGAILLSEAAFKASTSAGKPSTVKFRFVSDPADRACTLDAGVLELRVCLTPPADAKWSESGFFCEPDIAKIISDRLGLETMPLIGSLQDEMIPKFRDWMNGNLESQIDVQVDWDGFLTHEDVGKNKWALDRLEQDGLNNLYYALSNVAEKSAEFAKLIRGRVRKIHVQHVPKPGLKALLGEGNTLVFRIFLHEGYDGRLTIDEMTKLLPGLLADMTDAPAPEPKADPDADRDDGGSTGDSGGSDDADDSDDSGDSDDAPAVETDTRLVLLRGYIEAGLHHLTQGGTREFLMLFMAPELLMQLWQDGGTAFAKLTQDFEPRRELFQWAFRKAKDMTPEWSADGKAVFRFEDLPPGVNLEPLTFKESEGRWLLDIFQVRQE